MNYPSSLHPLGPLPLPPPPPTKHELSLLSLSSHHHPQLHMNSLSSLCPVNPSPLLTRELSLLSLSNHHHLFLFLSLNPYPPLHMNSPSSMSPPPNYTWTLPPLCPPPPTTCELPLLSLFLHHHHHYLMHPPPPTTCELSLLSVSPHPSPNSSPLLHWTGQLDGILGKTERLHKRGRFWGLSWWKQEKAIDRLQTEKSSRRLGPDRWKCNVQMPWGFPKELWAAFYEQISVSNRAGRCQELKKGGRQWAVKRMKSQR